MLKTRTLSFDGHVETDYFYMDISGNQLELQTKQKLHIPVDQPSKTLFLAGISRIF